MTFSEFCKASACVFSSSRAVPESSAYCRVTGGGYPMSPPNPPFMRRPMPPLKPRPSPMPLPNPGAPENEGRPPVAELQYPRMPPVMGPLPIGPLLSYPGIIFTSIHVRYYFLRPWPCPEPCPLPCPRPWPRPEPLPCPAPCPAPPDGHCPLPFPVPGP